MILPLTTASTLYPGTDTEPAVIHTPGGRHLEFTSNASIEESPFNNTLRYFKQYKGKENSPSKSRRNASLPEEIAELAREANEEEEDLDKYRSVDLAPMEPVVESVETEDLISFESPVKRAAETLRTVPEFDMESGSSTLPHFSVPDPEMQHSSRMSLPVEQDEESDADVETSDTAAPNEEKQLIVYPQGPTFVTVIGMLPKAMFWAAAAPVARLGTSAYDLLIEKFTGLELD
jgi:hypothetical protein